MFNSFIAIFDKDGDIQEVFGENVVDDLVWAMCRNLDNEWPDCAPHKPYKWHSEGQFSGTWRHYV